MIGGRMLANATRNGYRVPWKILNTPIFDNTWHSFQTFRSASHAIPTQKAFDTPHNSNGGPRIPDQKFVMRMFSQRGNNGRNGENSNGASLASKLIASMGAMIGIGISGATDDSNQNQGMLGDWCYKAACAEDCIEKKCEESACLRKDDCEEELIRKANGDLEKALKDVKCKAVEYTEAAMKAYCEAIALMRQYMNQGYCAIDNDELEPPQYEETWCCIYDISVKRCEKVRDALQKGQCAWELLCRLKEVIENGKACKYTACNPLLVIAEESLCCAERELLNLKAKMDCLNSDHEMVSLYRCVVEDFKKDLRASLKASGDLDTCKVQFPEQETAMMINQAYLRVVRVHTELAKMWLCNDKIPECLQKTMC